MRTGSGRAFLRVLAVGAVAAALVGGAAALHAALGPRYGGEIVVATLELPPDQGPAAPRSPEHRLLMGLVHDRLIDISLRGELIPRLASSWTPSADGREWTIALIQNAGCQDDETADAEAVLQSLRRLLRSPTAAGAALALTVEGGQDFRDEKAEQVAGMRAIDARRIALRLGPGGESRLAPLASWAAAITSKDGAPCGPFAPARTKRRRSAAFTASATHWAGRPLADRVRVVAYSSREELVRAVRDGKAHLAMGVGAPQGLAPRLLLSLNTRSGPFARRGARRLVASLDRTALATRFLEGALPLFSLFPSNEPGASTRRRTSFPSARLRGSATLAVAKDVPPLASQRVAAHLLALGLSVEVRPVPREALAATKADARLMLWTPDVPESGQALRELAMLLDEPNILELCDAAEATPDEAARTSGLARAETALLDQHALVPLALTTVALSARDELHDVRVDAAGGIILEDAWLAP